MFYNNNSNQIFFVSGWRLIGLLLSFAVPVYSQTNADYVLESDAKRCVALRQGQTCYKKVKLRWRAPNSGNYCVYVAGSNTPLQCWQQQLSNEMTVDFESGEDTVYVLRQENTSNNLAEFTISVSWVYEPQQDSSSNWRLF